jgi:bacteriorhodopsin
MVSPVHVNRTFADRRLTVGGSDWLWVVTVIMGFSALFALAFAKTVSLFLYPTFARSS